MANAPARPDPRIRFLTMLGRSLHSYGIPSHRLETALTHAAARLDIRAEFLSTPTSLIAAYGEPGAQRVELVRVHPGELQLDKLLDLDETVQALYRGDLTLEDADRRLMAVDTSPQRYGAVLTIAAFGVTAASACRFFGGAWLEVAVALGVGVMGGMVGWLAGRHEALARIQVLIISVLAAFLAGAATLWTGPMATGEVVLGALIVLLPGLTLTTSLNELSTGHLVAGTARLVGSLATFVQIGVGVEVGRRLAELLTGGVLHRSPPPLPDWSLWVMLGLTPLALGVLFRSRMRELPWIVLGSLVAFWSARLGVGWLGAGLGTALGALSVGLAGNLFARLAHKPSVVVTVPSLILLVPGSIGYRSLGQLMNNDLLTGLDTAFGALLVGVSLVSGLLLANVLLPSRNVL